MKRISKVLLVIITVLLVFVTVLILWLPSFVMTGNRQTLEEAEINV